MNADDAGIEQPTLFGASLCVTRGTHSARPKLGPPRAFDDCVNRDVCCRDCGLKLGIESRYTGTSPRQGSDDE